MESSILIVYICVDISIEYAIIKIVTSTRGIEMPIPRVLNIQGRVDASSFLFFVRVRLHIIVGIHIHVGVCIACIHAIHVTVHWVCV